MLNGWRGYILVVERPEIDPDPPGCQHLIECLDLSRGVIDSGLVGSTDFHSSHPQAGRGTTRAEDAQGTPTQSHISPSIVVYEHSVQPR